jgi:hypothetical protein
VTNKKFETLFLMTGAISPNRRVVNRTIVWAPLTALIPPAKNIYLRLPTEENILSGRECIRPANRSINEVQPEPDTRQQESRTGSLTGFRY